MGKGRNGDAVVIADDHRFDLTRAVNEEADAAVECGGECGQRTGGFTAEDFLGTPLFLGQPFKIPELLGLKTADDSGDGGDGCVLRGKRCSASAGGKPRRTRKGDDVANIGHTGDKLHQALKAKAKAGMGHRTKAAQIQIPGIFLQVQSSRVHASG